MKGTWYEVSNGETRDKKLALWMRKVWLGDDGKLFVPSVFFSGNPNVTFICASSDGAATIMSGKHLYYDADWVKREKPETAATIDKIRARLGAKK